MMEDVLFLLCNHFVEAVVIVIAILAIYAILSATNDHRS